MNRLYPEAAGEAGMHPTAVVGRDVEMGAGVIIEAHSVIGDGAKIGRGVRIGPHCSIAPGV
jgi:UDP-3-O-[3-hydroxymyristoyl] glucosamine N-acyltransferase